MYDYLEGKIAEKTPTLMTLDVHGVGYSVFIPLSTFAALPALGETVRLLTHFVVREDGQALYGFFTVQEREIFRLLISVTGIGPKMAMTTLSGIPVEELKQAIVSGAVHVLTNISGIGKKTAERIIVELREKVVLETKRLAPATAGIPGVGDQLVEDSLQALVSLGYRKQDAKTAVEKALKNSSSTKFSVEELIRASLKSI